MGFHINNLTTIQFLSNHITDSNYTQGYAKSDAYQSHAGYY